MNYSVVRYEQTFAIRNAHGKVLTSNLGEVFTLDDEFALAVLAEDLTKGFLSLNDLHGWRAGYNAV